MKLSRGQKTADGAALPPRPRHGACRPSGPRIFPDCSSWPPTNSPRGRVRFIPDGFIGRVRVIPVSSGGDTDSPPFYLHCHRFPEIVGLFPGRGWRRRPRVENRHDLPGLFRQRTPAFLDPKKQGPLNASPDGGKFHRTSGEKRE